VTAGLDFGFGGRLGSRDVVVEDNPYALDWSQENPYGAERKQPVSQVLYEFRPWRMPSLVLSRLLRQKARPRP